MVISPITHSSNTKFETSIPCELIIENYKKFNIDVTKYFHGLPLISIYKCLDTGYRFFYPLNIDGDSSFYEQLQKFDWYYMPWKWEHEQADSYLRSGMNVLEVGCANGEFLKRVKSRVGEVVGLELNQVAVDKGTQDGIRILNETIQDHSKKYDSYYDVVCSFQVLEHIADVRSFLQASVKLLKDNGTMIVSVPNNDSFLGLSTNYLNMPPHHMGLWNQNSLSNIAGCFGLKLKGFHLEPLQQYHRSYFTSTMIKYYGKRFNWLKPICNFLLPFVIPRVIGLFSNNLKAYTIQAVYEKN